MVRYLVKSNDENVFLYFGMWFIHVMPLKVSIRARLRYATGVARKNASHREWDKQGCTIHSWMPHWRAAAFNNVISTGLQHGVSRMWNRLDSHCIHLMGKYKSFDYDGIPPAPRRQRNLLSCSYLFGIVFNLRFPVCARLTMSYWISSHTSAHILCTEACAENPRFSSSVA